MKMMVEEFKKKSLSGNTIKLIAIIAMIIDHGGWAFVSTNTIGAVVMHTIGKITGPVLIILLLSSYNGTKGGSKYSKWMFYIIYPLQFLIIGGIVLLLSRV